LTVQGSQFVNGAQVVIDGSVYAASYISATELQLTVPSLPTGTLPVLVRNPGNIDSSNSANVVISGPAATATPTPGVAGPLQVLEAVFHPHPIRGPHLNLRFKLDGAAERVRLRLYSPAMVLGAELEAEAAFTVGWNQAQFSVPALASGLWFCVVQAQQGSRQSLRAPPLRLYKLP
jgi:hypothetical protein